MGDMQLNNLFAQPGLHALEALGDAVLGFDAEGRCLHAGLPAMTLLQVSSLDDLLGKTVAELLPMPWPGSLPPWDQCLAHMRAHPDRLLRSDLETVQRRNGVDAHVAIAILTVAGAEGRSALAVVLRDVGERARQSKAFHASVKSYRALLDGVSDAIFFVSRQGRVVDANEGVQSMFGHSPAAFQGKSIDNLIDTRVHEIGLITAAVADAVDGAGRRIEFCARHRKGGQFPAEAYLYPSSYFNQPVALVIVHDISERKRQEAALVEARDQAEQSSRLKSEIIRNMSHEFRTPLAAIIGMVDLLADTGLDDEQAGYLDEARTGARNLLAMVNAMLELAKLESGQYRSGRFDFSIADLLSTQSRRQAAAATAKGLSLEVVSAPELPDMVSGDMEGIGKVLTLLLDNAVKFTPSGKIELHAALIEPEGAPEEGIQVRFSVLDTGIGIAPEQCEHLFETFVQGDGSATRDHGGIGLGIASRLVKVMGGTLAVDSTPGAGCEFHFVLSLEPPEFQ
jgi:PAS domain S-box-containing protein